MNLGSYGKAIAALIVGIIGWATLVVASDAVKITGEEWIGLATAVAAAFGVYVVRNDPA